MGVLSNLEPQNVFHFFEEITKIPHGSGNVGQISDYLVKFARDRGLFCIQDELKNIIIKYYPSGGTNELNGVLFDIFTCEQELASHNAVEDGIFIPAVERLAADGVQSDEKQETLSAREREIIVCVVKGMTNKQIADCLCISAHTVITHRRNIAAKLQIHSAAGLTIYAIVNKLVDLSEIKETIGD